MELIVPNLLVVISGPSGVGKGCLVRELINSRTSAYALSVSVTTRPPRAEEYEGEHYFFVTKERFRQMIKEEKLLEWAEVFGDLYGTPRSFVEKTLASGKDILLEIDVQGAIKVKNAMPDALLIFVLPPGWKELRKRLMNRGTESEEKMRERLDVARVELKALPNYDYFLVNDNLQETAQTLEKLICAEKHRVSRLPVTVEGGPNKCSILP